MEEEYDDPGTLADGVGETKEDLEDNGAEEIEGEVEEGNKNLTKIGNLVLNLSNEVSINSKPTLLRSTSLC